MPKPPRVCFDRVLPKNFFVHHPTIRRRGGPDRAITPIGKLWMNGSTLHVKFMGGTAAQRNTAKTQANWWTEHANLKFVFDNSPNAEIRISFDDTDGAWSWIGTEAREIPLDQATMNLGFLDGGTAGHEFGHAIGLAHEHQNPQGGILWNEAKVIQALAGPPNNWPESVTRHNVLNKYSADQVNGTAFDPDSIMLYFFPASWTLNGIGTDQNDVLSAMDKSFAAGAQMYPHDGTTPANAAPISVNGAAVQASIGAPGEEDLFKFKAASSGKYVIETKGSTDVVMKLFGPNSQTNVIAEDDDSGLGFNARISANLLAGDYFVQIRHYNTAGGTGNYSITVKKA